MKNLVWLLKIASTSLALTAPAFGFCADADQAQVLRAKEKYQLSQKKRCNEGVAYACYDYGITLSLSKSQAKQAEGERFIRRACTLAYAPACKQRAMGSVREAGRRSSCVNDNVLRAAQVQSTGGGQKLVALEKGSLFEKMGFLPGDIIKSVNGTPTPTAGKLIEAISDGDGQGDLVIERQGATIPLVFHCPPEAAPAAPARGADGRIPAAPPKDDE